MSHKIYFKDETAACFWYEFNESQTKVGSFFHLWRQERSSILALKLHEKKNTQSSDGHFVQQRKACRWYAQLRLIYHTCEVCLKSHHQFDLWKSNKVFLLLALVAILCSEAEHAGMHNQCWYWSLLWSLVKIVSAVWPVKAAQDFLFLVVAALLCSEAEQAGSMENQGTRVDTDHSCEVWSKLG